MRIYTALACVTLGITLIAVGDSGSLIIAGVLLCAVGWLVSLEFKGDKKRG